MLPFIWFCLVALMIAGYVILDGFDLGAGVIHLLIARSSEERKLVLRSIGPVWDGNEVWLLAAGGTLYFAFPALYASSFSGFYLPLMMVLWLLILRGISIEFRNHIDSPIWIPLWDASFGVSSALLAIFFGAALGNVIRGVPLDQAGDFFLPLWTNFAPGPQPGVLDWYTVLIGVLAFFSLAVHGALWLAYKTENELNTRARSLARTLWWPLGLFTAAATAASFAYQPQDSLQLPRVSLGRGVPAARAGGIRRNALVENRIERVPLLLYVPRGNAHQRGVRSFSVRPAIQHLAHPGIDTLQRGDGRIRSQSRPYLVDSRNGPSGVVLHLRLPQIRRQNSSN